MSFEETLTFNFNEKVSFKMALAMRLTMRLFYVIKINC